MRRASSWGGDTTAGAGVPASGIYATSDTDVLASQVAGDTSSRFVINADGKLEWGDGSAALDTNLYRSAANTLKTDDAFIAAGLTLADATNLIVNTTTGSKIGTATTQKLGFWNAAPVVQPAAQADASGGAIIDIEARAALNGLLAKLRTIGIIAT